MSRKRKHGAHANHERWLVSYADFITLLFAFFVVLYASSQVDKAKMGKLAAAIQGAFQQMGVFNGAAVGPPIENNDARAPEPEAGEGMGTSDSTSDLAKKLRMAAPSVTTPLESNQKSFTKTQILNLKRDLEAILTPEIKRHEVALRIGPEGLVVSLSEMGFFDSGSCILKPGSEGSIARIALLLRQRQAAMRIEGHTDNVPIHTPQFSSNWELSTARATEMIRLLISKYSFPPEHLSAAGYGEFHPVATNANEAGRRQNRRLDIVILAARPQDSVETLSQSASTSHAVNDQNRVLR
jgi:chemotaxis protein MotB